MVLRLGGFHTEMSFLGCTGQLMAKSGLQELLELIYASNAVVHMLTGKTIVRAVRGHFIVDAALNALILASTFNVPIPASDEEIEQLLESAQAHEGSSGMTDLDVAALLYDKLMQGLVSADQVCQDNVMAKRNFSNLLERLHCGCSTWTWLTFFANISGQSAHATGNYISKLFQKCFLT